MSMIFSQENEGIGHSQSLHPALLVNPPKAPQRFFISASLLDDLEFHVISPPFLA
jgi:hypothetical protein